MPYILIYLYLLSIMIVELKNIEVKNKILNNIFNYKVGFVVLFLFVALRGNGNGDYFRYIENVEIVSTIDFLFHPVDYPFELGFRILAYIVNLLHLPPQFVLIFMNAISFSAVYYFVKKHSKIKSLSLVLFFPIVLLFDMHHSRSAVAMSLGLVIFDALLERKYLKSLTLFILAFLFHKSAVILLILLPIVLIKKVDSIQDKLKNRVFIKTGFIILVMIFFYFVNPFDLVVKLTDTPFTQYIHIKISSYLEREQWSYAFKLYDPRLLILIFTYLTYDLSNNYKNKFTNKLHLINLLAILTIVILNSSTILVIRAYNFFNIFSIILIPNMIKELDKSYCSKLIERLGSKVSVISKLNSEMLIKVAYTLIVIGFILYTFMMIRIQFDYRIFIGGL